MMSVRTENCNSKSLKNIAKLTDSNLNSNSFFIYWNIIFLLKSIYIMKLCEIKDNLAFYLLHFKIFIVISVSLTLLYSYQLDRRLSIQTIFEKCYLKRVSIQWNIEKIKFRGLAIKSIYHSQS